MLEKHFRALEAMYHAAPINEFFLPVAQIGEGRAIIEIEVRPTLFHAAGAAHGSVYFKCLDDAAFFAANSLETELFLNTVTFTTYFTRPIAEGMMHCEGRLLNRTRSQFIAEAAAFNEDGREIARGSGIFLRSRTALRSVETYATTIEAA